MCKTYCALCCARTQSRLARSRFHGRAESFDARASQAELFEDGEPLRGEAVDDEDDTVAWHGAVDTDDQLDATERPDTT